MEYLEDDDNFVWTDASNSASSDSDSSMKNKMGDQSGGEESEYGKKYKKQLHKQLFDDHHDDDEQQHSQKKKHKKKRKLEQETSETETSEPRRKKNIKLEVESDVDAHHNTRKHEPYDEHFLDEQVKQEQNFLFPEKVKSKKKKHKSTSQTNGYNSTVNDTDNDTITLSTADCDHRVSITEEPGYEHTSVKKKKKKKKSEKRNSSPENNGVRQVEECEPSMAHTRHDDLSRQDLTVNLTSGDPDISEISRISKGDLTYNDSYDRSIQPTTTQTKPMLVEKLQFEGDLMDLESCQTNVNTSRTVVTQLSDKLKKFGKSNTKLKPCNIQSSNNFSIDDRDEVWIINCPRDIDISAFNGKSLNLENKCKIKLNGQTYEGNADPIKAHTSIIISENGQVIVNNVTINGYLNLHRRLPKVQVHEDSVMVNNQSNFIPLPDTKCRHPLLGSHYKRAMKLPVRVAQRLRAIHTTNDNTDEVIHHTPKTEKRKKQTSYDQKQIVTDDTSVDLSKEERKKKKTKRKHSEVEEEQPESTHKKKRKKYNLEAAETWESEQAIEQSLFDY